MILDKTDKFGKFLDEMNPRTKQEADQVLEKVKSMNYRNQENQELK